MRPLAPAEIVVLSVALRFEDSDHLLDAADSVVALGLADVSEWLERTPGWLAGNY